MKRAQKNFERDPTKKNFWSNETLRDPKAKIHEQSSWINKTTMPPIEVIANCELCMTKYWVNRLIGSKYMAKTSI